MVISAGPRRFTVTQAAIERLTAARVWLRPASTAVPRSAAAGRSSTMSLPSPMPAFRKARWPGARMLRGQTDGHPGGKLLPRMALTQIRALGGTLFEAVDGFGQFVNFCFATLTWMIRDLVRWHRWRLIWPQMYDVGTKSIPVVMLTGAFIGMVLAVELFEQFSNFGQASRLGGVINISVVKHLGPVLAAVMLAGRVGGAFAAELGTMTVTEQVEALRVMGAAPVSYLVVPRVIACVVMIPVMTVFSDLLGIGGSWMITVAVNGVTNNEYWSFSEQFVSRWDVFTGLAKSLAFGLAIALISRYKGFHWCPRRLGRGQGDQQRHFVTSFVTIIILNFFLAKFSNDLHRFLFGLKPSLLG